MSESRRLETLDYLGPDSKQGKAVSDGATLLLPTFALGRG
jgi:hypothetical protein